MSLPHASPLTHSETTTISETIKILQELENELEETSKEVGATRRRLITLAEDEASRLKATLLEKTDAVTDEMVKSATDETSKKEKEILSQVEKDLSQLRKKIESARAKAVSLVIDSLTAP